MDVNEELWTMSDKIIVDSCCDMTQQLQEQLNATPIPLTMRLGQVEYTDDASLDLPGFMSAMKACRDAVRSASPAPFAYQKAFEHPFSSFAVTLSSKLSGSYASALLGKRMAEENGYRNIHVFDSKSASAGEVLVAVKIKELIETGIDRKTIIQRIESFIDNMKTYFVLERYENLQKNGRLNKITGKIISVMNIKLVMGADGNGNIALFSKPRGIPRMLENLVELIESSGKTTEGELLVISHCNNESLAHQLSQRILDKFRFKEILVVPTGGLSSMYADDKGLIMAF